MLTMTPPQPWSFPVPVNPESTGTGYVTAGYAYLFYAQRPPTALSCLTGDELLDQQAMRDLLNTLWAGSHVGNPPATRREVRGFLFEDSTGNVIYGAYPDTVINPPLDTLQDTPCSSVGMPPNPLPGFILASGHTHPWRHKETVPIGVCGVTQPGFWYDALKFGGPSPKDYAFFDQVFAPPYVMDKDNIYVAPIGTDSLNWNGRVKKYPRVGQGGCTLP